MGYIKLHVHTDASTLDGSCRLKDYVAKCKEMGDTACGISDHGNMINALAFQEECDRHGMKPVFGCEFYMGDAGTKDKFHLILIAKNNEGLKNLYNLNAYAYTKNFYSKPRIDLETLRSHSKGLICTTACLGSELAEMSRHPLNNSVEYLAELSGMFGADWYLELQSNTLQEQEKYNNYLYRVAQMFSCKCIVTTDAHYVNKEDSEVHDTLLCMQTNKKKDDEKRFRFSVNEFYIQTEREIFDTLHYLDANFICDCIENTKEIAGKCTARIDTNQNLLPKMCDNSDYELALKCNEGYAKRFDTKRTDVIDRIKYELKVIKEKGYSDYFLIVQDYIQFAKDNGIDVGPGRGSGAGSEVAYVLGITNIEPIQHGLLFERFLNPERMSAPDFDIDFCYERRGEVIEYVKNKYGSEHVCNIIAKGCLTAKSVCRKVLTAYGFEQRAINTISKTIPEDVGMTLELAYSRSPEFKMYMMDNPVQYNEMLKLEDGISHVSKHAAGLVISPVPVKDVIPCMSDAEDRTMYMSQWDKKEIEKIGLFKFDFLGLKTLTIFRKTFESVKRLYGIQLDWNSIDLHTDPKLYATLNSNHIKGVFQLSSPSAEQVTRQIHPECFEDVVAANALCRPGVKERDLYVDNKKIANDVEYANDIIREILAPTYGAIVYQEQTMLLMNKLAGWSLGKADKMRKVKDLEEFREDFVNCCNARGIDSDTANSIYSRFSLKYSFNKSHAVSYADITMMSLYLLTYYPKEFMAAVMTLELYAQKPDFKSLIKQCQALGVPVIPPDINMSTEQFTSVCDGVLFPLTMINGVGGVAVQHIMNSRPFATVEDMVAKVKRAKVKKNNVVALIKAGCFDRVAKLNRSALLQQYDSECTDIYDDDKCRQYEVQTLGFMLTSHPLIGQKAKKFSELDPNVEHTYNIVIDEAKMVTDKKGNHMAFMTVETAEEMINCVVFSRTYERIKHLAKDGIHCTMTGKKDGNSFMVSNLY